MQKVLTVENTILLAICTKIRSKIVEQLRLLCIATSMAAIDALFQVLYGFIYLILSLMLLLAVALYYVRPFNINPKLPGPRRFGILGVTFADELTEAFGEPFEWSRWPKLSLELSRQWNFRTWGGPTLNNLLWRGLF